MFLKAICPWIISNGCLQNWAFVRSKYYTPFYKPPLKWISHSKSRASKSRPRWAAHTHIGNVWEYPPPPPGARHANDFTWNRGCSSNSPPLTHGDQIPHPLEDSPNQIPSSPARQRCQMPGVCPGGGGGMLKLRFDRYIISVWILLQLNEI